MALSPIPLGRREWLCGADLLHTAQKWLKKDPSMNINHDSQWYFDFESVHFAVSGGQQLGGPVLCCILKAINAMAPKSRAILRWFPQRLVLLHLFKALSRSFCSDTEHTGVRNTLWHYRWHRNLQAREWGRYGLLRDMDCVLNWSWFSRMLLVQLNWRESLWEGGIQGCAYRRASSVFESSVLKNDFRGTVITSQDELSLW